MSEKAKKEIKEKKENIEEIDNNVEIDTNLNISEEVIGIIAGLAASEVEGIAGMTLGFVDGINQILGGNKKYSKGVKIELEGKRVTIDLYVNVKYGVRIPDIAWAAQNAVKSAVENMTGLDVVAVNINVQGITFDKKEETKQDTEE